MHARPPFNPEHPARRRLLIAGCTLALAVGSFAPTASAASRSARTAVTSARTPVAPAAAPAGKIFTSTVDGGTSIAISPTGKIATFVSPNGSAHFTGITRDGYVLCADGVPRAFDVGTATSGFGTATTTSPSATTFRVTRATTDGLMRLVQDFTFLPASKSLTVKTTVQNVTTNKAFDVILIREADFDVDSGGANAFAHDQNLWMATNDSVTAWNDTSNTPAGKTPHGMVLRSLARSDGSPFHKVGIAQNPSEPVCSPILFPSPRTTPEDRGAVIENFATLSDGASFSATVSYERI